ncbi:lipopolysaccharide biosynthesis protein [Cohnella sp. JJ-181]|uniref:lipopolysaccharide biosynthesis protein n=1 Tax=Cohnella rhizoplanae TaxID=2974897 RepID=UPI00232F9615|nr:lipopolysaccharide biosynthesis protein [Cohnella sp. JJ-181]
MVKQLGTLGNEKDELKRKTYKGFLWMFSGTGLQVITQLFLTVLLSRILTPEDFGSMSAALIIIGFSVIFTSLGIGPALVQRPIINPKHITTGYTISILFGGLLTLIVYFFSPYFSVFFNNEDLNLILKVFSFVFIIQSFGVVSESLLSRDLEFKVLSKIQMIANTLGYGFLSISLAILGLGVWSLIIGYMTQELIKTLFLVKKKKHNKSIGLDKSAFKELMYFGGGFTIARVFNYGALQGDNLVVGRWLGPEALGLYGRVYQLMAMPAVLIGQVLDKVLFSSMSKIQHEKQALINSYSKGLSLVALLVAPISVYVYLFASDIVKVVLGQNWGGIVTPLKIFSLGMFFRTSYKISESVARATGAVYRRAWRQLLYALLVIAGSIFGLQWGIMGVALGVLVALFVNFILMAQLSLNLLGLSWIFFIKLHLPPLILSLILLFFLGIAKTFLLGAHFPSILNLILAFVGNVLLVLFLIYIKPTFFLGDGMAFVVKKLKGRRVP